jgi:hypothetical protein
VFESRVPRKIFGSKREEVVGGWRRLCIEELHNLHALLNIGRPRCGWKYIRMDPWEIG